MPAGQQQRSQPIVVMVLFALVLVPPALDLIDDIGFDGLGGLAWEFAHGLPVARRLFREGWREHAERRAAEREA